MNIFIFLIISIFNYIKLEIISFSLEYFYNDNPNTPLSSKLNNIYNIYIYSITKIGEPQFNIKTIFSFDNCYFYIEPKLELIDEKELSDNYNITKTNTFQNISSFNKAYILSNKDIAAKEKFIFNIYNLETKESHEMNINDLDFILGVRSKKIEIINKTDVYYLNIGLSILNSQTEKYNFINLLKERNITNNYNWFISFENFEKDKDKIYNLDEIIKAKPKLIIGCLPHQYYPGKYLENNLMSEYSSILNFKNIYYYVNDSKYNNELKKEEINRLYHEAFVDFNYFPIIAPYIYKTKIQNDFFMNYMSKNICHYYYDSQIEGFYCDKSEKFTIDDLKTFPTLYFEHNELNYTFDFNYQDLFIEKDNKYWFLIVCENGDAYEWILGYVLLKKYQFAFNQDSKTIRFYNQNLKDDDKKEIEDEKDIDDNGIFNNKIFLIILIVISWVVFIALGFLLGKYLYKKYNKKKRANELDDDNYEYITDKNIN